MTPATRPTERTGAGLAAVTVIIVNFNTGRATIDCLASAAAALSGIPWDAVVVDNASAEPIDVALDALPQTQVIRNPANVGFGTAVNQAARASTSPFLWLLNPDCTVEPGAFRALAAVLEGDDRCALAAPQLRNPDGSLQASARGEPSAWTGLFGRNTSLTRYFPSSRVVRRNLPAADLVAANVASATVDWVMGAVMLIRRNAFEAIAGFDERFFLYWEDADLCHRLRDRGFSIRYVPGARVTHAGGASTQSDRALAIRAFHRSAYLYYATHVVPQRWHPLRLFARAALAARAALRIRYAR